MSKYKALLGLAKEVLPSGERVLIREDDDILRTLQGLDERRIENIVSQMDAHSRAKGIKDEILEKVAPYGESSLKQRSQARKDFNTPDTEYDRSREIGYTYFPKKYDEHLNLDEIAELVKQYDDNLRDTTKVATQKTGIMRKLRKLNPNVDSYPLYEALTDGIIPSDEMQSIARERFKKIRDAMKGEK